ncbi:AfsR/SARP family transcriptional regulator [Actinoplanes cyaneus]|uniref:AfsR/SARP family transcriptional regulator n=1 Tax=Actinoplanes cyaneus TaxID=52696 RepID=UPI001943B200|nr:BTAD domain-containing putative transcriptional regulator [Actinoplanes cyaneus]MCW2140910.1 putative ATPase [Actinoplanes cyaneus]
MSEHGERAGRLRVELFGGLRAGRGSADLAVPGARLRGLLVRLALAAGRPVGAGALVDSLWPLERPADPANALQSLVSRLRRVLGDADAVLQDEGGYRLAVGDDDVDVIRFERLAGNGRQKLRAGDAHQASEVLGAAIGLLRGPVAVEVGVVAEAVGVRLGRAVSAALADAAETDLLLGRYDVAEGRLTRLNEEHPLDERVAGLLMDTLAAQGRQADALALYERIREEVADRLGADPGAALRERHLQLLRGSGVSDLGGGGSGPGGFNGGGSGPGGHEEERAAAERAAGERAVAEGAGAERAAAERAAGRGAHDVRANREAETAGRPAASNLPEPLTSFIGREADLARVDELLGAGRLITVLGPGGAGKTRLATQAARRRRGEFRDGVWLIDLASVTAPAELPAAVLTATGLRASAIFAEGSGLRLEGRTDVDVLVDQFAGRECLFLVDNCEHLIDAVAHLATALLVRCPGLRILATSREPLAVDGEALVPLGPLGVPEQTELDAARESPAVRLFAERTAAVLPGFALDEATVEDVVQIVRRLDGLPLALELAAARLRTLGLRELADGLDDRFRLLTTGSRTALPRHRTLRAVIAWSWELLAGDERIVAERVSVLPGGVTVGSATAVCADAGVPAALIPDLLAALVDKSLLQRAPEGRYRMLETLREYGIDQLASQRALTGTRRLAAGYLAALVAEHDPRLRTAEQLDALAVLRAEYDNALAALRHLCDEGDADGATRLALSLVWYWQMFGRHADAAFWLNEALRLPGERSRLVTDCAEAVLTLNRVSGEVVTTAETAQQRQDRMRALADRLMSHAELPGLVGALSAVVLFMAEEGEAAQARMNQLVDGPDTWVAALAQLFRAQVAENNGDVDQVRVDVTAALAGFRAAGDRWGQATVLPLRALLRQYEGDLDGALADLTAAKSLAGEFGSLDLGDEVFIDLRRADLHLRRGEPDDAMVALAGARARAQRSTAPEMMLLIDGLEAGMMVTLGRLDRAEELVARAEAELPVDEAGFMNGDHGTAIIEGVRATLALRQGDRVRAERALIRAYEAAQETRDMPILSLVAVGAAGLADLTGRPREAAQLLGAAARLRGAHDPTDLQVAELTRRNRAVLGEDGFAEAYAAGWALDPNTALARANPGQLRAIEG